MARSAIDATRFTSTTPHVASKPSTPIPNLSRDPLGSLTHRTAGPPGETPKEKVKRLREAAARARDAKIPTFDKVIIIGRVWADRAHRFTALSLIGLTGIAGAVTAYALGDMIIYNRRKRAEYYAQQPSSANGTIQEVQKAAILDTATEEQRSPIKGYEQATKTKSASKTPGIFARSREWLFSGLKKEDLGTSEQSLGYEGTSRDNTVLGRSESDILSAFEKKVATKANAETPPGKERELEPK